MNIGLSAVIMLLFAVFLEIYILIAVGASLGGLLTIFLVVFSSVFGYLLVKYQTGNTLANVQQSLMRGEAPKLSIIEAGVVMFGGILLMIPGFITDVMGIVTLIPPFRKMMANRILGQMMHKMNSAIASAQMSENFEQEPDITTETKNDPNESSSSDNHTIEGEYKRED